jgi:hypothetical protein
MRVNEVLESVSKEGSVAIMARNYFICGYAKDVIYDNDFIKRKIGDYIVTHLGVCRTARGFGISINCGVIEDDN